MRKPVIEIEWPKIKIIVEAVGLDFNRKYAEKFFESLPFKTIQLHAMVTGELIYSYCPLNPIENMHLAEKRLRIHKLPPGYVSWGGLGLVGIKYGPCTEPLRTQPIAQIPERFHVDLKRAGRATWEAMFNTKEKLVVEFREKGGRR